jgi:hypothetical protein
MPAICLISSSWSFPMCANGVEGFFFCKTLRMSWDACMATSVGVVYGTLVFVGKNSTVWVIHVALVLVANT